MLQIEYHTKFRRDYRLAKKRGYDLMLLRQVIALLASEQPLPPQYRDHALTASREYKEMRECHIQPDWLLIYHVDADRLVLDLMRTGTHSDLF